ncbi:filensin-like [Acipenser oxyrinchus oxyrinchus]|uniref:Filensin n=1 Tax=Acipenser oxyrinchus oxyrinchus TaxID=40147 RepID=A0AAD8GBI8_ACIOX|nr:filensin-like [Acipenser oxyrinchus oxyrinchus]
MYKTSYLREVHKEKYEQSDTFEDQKNPEVSSLGSVIQGWESLQELNDRFAKYINRARVLEQRNAVFRKQLETLQRMEELSGLEEAFTEQIGLNRMKIRELSADRSKLQRELKDAERMLDEFQNKYRNECEYQQELRGTLEQFNKEADAALLENLELQMQSQFLQDDINATKDRHKKNLAEIQTYVNILQQIIQTSPRMPDLTEGISEGQEKLLAERRVPSLQSQLEEYKNALWQLQTQKQRLQTETSVLEQAIKNTQESYDDEIQLYNEQIEALRKDIEESERTLEKYTGECRHLAMYRTSLENELDRYKRIIENEDNRLNSAIIGTPIALFTTSYRYSHTPSITPRGKDITQAVQDITSAKPRQKSLAKKVLKKKEITTKDVTDNSAEEKTGDPREEGEENVDEEEVRKEEHGMLYQDVEPEDVPDGAQISKAFDSLCNIVRERIRRYKKPEPIADFYTKGRYVLVTGEASYVDPFFCSTSPSSGQIIVKIQNDLIPPDDLYKAGDNGKPTPPLPMPPKNGKGDEKEDDKGKGRDGNSGIHKTGGNGDHPKPTSFEDPGPGPCPGPSVPPRHPPRPHSRNGKDNNHDDKNRRGMPPLPPTPPPRTNPPADSMSYEKVEVVESVEKVSEDDQIHAYEETAMIVETMIEKTCKKKHGDKSF